MASAASSLFCHVTKAWLSGQVCIHTKLSVFGHNVHMSHRLILASDYDGTLAEHGVLSGETAAALKEFRKAGGILILVTGRDMQDIAGEGRPPMTPYLGLFDCIVAENGAILWDPVTGTEERTARPIPVAWRDALCQRFPNMFAGHEILSIPTAYEGQVRAFLKEQGIGLQCERNVGSLMLTMPGVDKASGLRAAARRLHLDLADVVGVGDGENDAALLSAVGTSVAVANAHPDVKRIADYVTAGQVGAGIRELLALMLEGKLMQLRGKGAGLA